MFAKNSVDVRVLVAANARWSDYAEGDSAVRESDANYQDRGKWINDAMAPKSYHHGS